MASAALAPRGGLACSSRAAELPCQRPSRWPRASRQLQPVRAAAAQEVAEEEESEKIAKLLAKPYKYGFSTLIETEQFPKGLSEDVVRAISAKKEEPEWLLEFR